MDTDGKRACGLVTSSGKNRLWLDFASSGLKEGSVKTPGAPRRGKEVSVIGTSLALRYLLASRRLEPRVNKR